MQVAEKGRERLRRVHMAFLDLEKVHYWVDGECLWRSMPSLGVAKRSHVKKKVLQMYGVDGKLLNGMKSFYANSNACVRYTKFWWNSY